MDAHVVQGHQGIEKPLPNPASEATSLEKPEESLSRIDMLQNKVKDLLKATGIVMSSPTMSFLEMGLDSLLLTQVALTFKKRIQYPIDF